MTLKEFLICIVLACISIVVIGLRYYQVKKEQKKRKRFERKHRDITKRLSNHLEIKERQSKHGTRK